MAILPIIILLLGALLMSIVRNRPERILWALTSGTALLTWIVSLVLVTRIPDVISLSVWKPTALFASRLELHLDAVGWFFLYGTSTILVSVAFTQAAQPGTTTPFHRAVMLAYPAIAMTAMLAGNMLTVAMSWALVDVLTLIFFIRIQNDRKSTSRLFIRIAVDGGGILLVLMAALLNGAEGGTSSLSTPMTSSTAAIFLVLAVLLRLGLLPPHITLQPKMDLQRHLGTLLHLLPPVTALSVLARMLNIGVPMETLAWLRVAGGLGVIIGGLRWAFHLDRETGRPFLLLGISGLGVLAAGLSHEIGGAPITAAGGVLLLSGAVFYLAEIFAPPHRAWVGLAALFLAGMPGTPTGVISAALTTGVVDTTSVAVTALGVIGLVLLTTGGIRHVFLPSTTWPTGESLVRVMYGLGLLLPLIVGFGLGLRMPGSVSLEAGIVFVITIGLSFLSVFLLRLFPEGSVLRWARVFAWLDPDPLYRILYRLSRVLVNIFRLIGELLEGEGAMLWMLVILLIVILAQGRLLG
ncbi:MAG: hypothetical protein AMJ88_00405 [Anaerolineae bacterium SM23_ 63]|nr:MAG: hypothetical protein AMJ88_00405 [Anaerolineae bacterium SM23_ 63]